MKRVHENLGRGAIVALALGTMILLSGMPAAAADTGSSKSQAAPVVVDLNTASAEELTAVPGIGPALSKRIVEFRQEHGPFQRVEDVLKVRGIGEKSFQKIKPYLTVKKSS